LFVERFLYDGIRERLEGVHPEGLAPKFVPLKAALDQLHLTIDDILIPVPRMSQAALFKVIKACRFALLYQWFPEPFGLLPLESVCLRALGHPAGGGFPPTPFHLKPCCSPQLGLAQKLSKMIS
jgi:hypothetical protein